MRRVALLLVLTMVAIGCGGGDVGDTSANITQPTSDESAPTDDSPTDTMAATTSTVGDDTESLPRYEGTVPALIRIDHQDFPPVVAEASMEGIYNDGVAAVMPSKVPDGYSWSHSLVSAIGTLFANEPIYEREFRGVPTGGNPSSDSLYVLLSVGLLADDEKPTTDEVFQALGYEAASDLTPVLLPSGEMAPIYVVDGRFGRSFVLSEGQHFIALQVDDDCEDDDSLRAQASTECLSWDDIQLLFDGLAVVSPESVGWSIGE